MSPVSSLSTVVATLRAAGCVFAEDEADLLVSAARTPEELTLMVERRAHGLPLEHVLGWAEFCGLRIDVDPGVFVPRRRTEFLVGQAVALARRDARDEPVVVVDLCCGSGAMGAALATALAPPPPGRVEVHAVDIDPAAVRCARRNLAAVPGAAVPGAAVPGATVPGATVSGAAVSGHVHEGDLYGPLPAVLRGRVDLLVASPPYVPTEAIRLLPTEARVHEPMVALDGGADGLDVVRRVARAAPLWLAPSGHLLVETSQRQARGTVEAVARAGLDARVADCEELGASVVIGTMPAAPVIAGPRV
ncbi:methyltransferase [Streptosporangium saharense]|uniref:methyltransferase n=1 Tax=Streptosporangium saharense TaxID=1706840 RepID=UPI00369A7556